MILTLNIYLETSLRLFILEERRRIWRVPQKISFELLLLYALSEL